MLGFAGIGAMAVPCQGEVRVKDIVEIEGVRANQLKGTGLVVGLDMTGSRSLATQQIAIDMLRKMDLTTKIARQSQSDNVFKSTSIAHVMVTAEIPPFARKGSRIDAVVSVLDDSTSLEGGTLILTPLEGADREVYAVAQGSISIGGFNVRTNATGAQKNHPTSGRLEGGVIVEREALGQIDQGGVVRLLLRRPDYATAKSITQVINRKYPQCARAIDGGTIEARIPVMFARDLPEFVNEIGQLKVTPDAPARVVINERTGTVTIGHQVRISAVSIAQNNLVIKPNIMTNSKGGDGGGVDPLPGAPPPLPGRPRDEIDDILEAIKPRELSRIPQTLVPLATEDSNQTYTVSELARVLNALGVSPRELIAIFQALEEQGALHAELIVM